MRDWLASTGVANTVIAIAMFEAILLLGYRWRTGRGIAASKLLPNLCAGLLLMLGVRAALAGAAWPWLPVFLVSAGLAHMLDVRMRWNREV